MKILIIDDEESIRDSFKWHLESLGYEVTTLSEPLFCEPCVGETKNHKHCYDVLIVDYNLPKMTGLDYVEEMSQRNCKGNVSKKIIISARTDWIDKNRANLLKCAIEQKPISLDRITELIAA